jgi:hypothetical protein
VTDFRNDTLHVLSSVGVLLIHINTPDLGIMNPYSLALDKMGDLLIGNNPDNEDNATLYRLFLTHPALPNTTIWPIPLSSSQSMTLM